MAKLNFQHHNPSLQSHMIFQKALYYADLVLKKHFLLLLMLRTVVLVNIFVETVIHFFRIIWWIQHSKEQHFFLLYIYKSVPVPFDQFNAYFLNKSTNIF